MHDGNSRRTFDRAATALYTVSVGYTFLLFPKKEAFIYERTEELYRRDLLQAVFRGFCEHESMGIGNQKAMLMDYVKRQGWEVGDRKSVV